MIEAEYDDRVQLQNELAALRNRAKKLRKEITVIKSINKLLAAICFILVLYLFFWTVL